VFERFTGDAREVVVLAQDEARRLRHNYVGTEHLLLGLLRAEEGVAARVLESLDITVEEVRAQVERIVGRGEEAAAGELPFTPRAKKVLDLSLREALALKHDGIGPEHILLGLVREQEGVGARILRDFDADEGTIRTAVARRVSAGEDGSDADQILVEIPGVPRARTPDSVATVLAALGFLLGLLSGWLIWGRRPRN
jgi:ATP-dependent Clp protease ATP-binding subunit ClpC